MSAQICLKCNNETATKRVKINLTIDSKNHVIIPVSARVQQCKTCNHMEYSEKEKKRLTDLVQFYRKEIELKDNEKEEDVKEKTA